MPAEVCGVSGLAMLGALAGGQSDLEGKLAPACGYL